MRADKIYINGKVYTVNEKQEWAEAVAIEDNKIIYVGDNAGAKALADDNTEVCDLDGKMMLPDSLTDIAILLWQLISSAVHIWKLSGALKNAWLK